MVTLSQLNFVQTRICRELKSGEAQTEELYRKLLFC
jgi:hypothetical protein